MDMSDDELPGIMSDDECELVLAVLQKVNLVVRLHAKEVLTSDKLVSPTLLAKDVLFSGKPLTPTQRGMLKAYIKVIKYTREEIKVSARRFGRDVPYYLFDPVGTKLFSAGKQAGPLSGEVVQ
jgi:hypothetical protein